MAGTSLGGNSIGSEGVKAIMAVLPRCSSLRSIEYVRVRAWTWQSRTACRGDGFTLLDGDTWNRGPEADRIERGLVRAPARACRDRLYGNSMGVEGAKAIAAALPLCTSLRTI